MHFNPRAPCGARLLWFKYSTEFIYFNPRAPCGARRTEHGEAVIREKFQSTRPVWGATKAAAGDRPRQLISIHAPRVGRDGLHALFVQQGRISIHAPRVGRDYGGGAGSKFVQISIHAPRVGRDLLFALALRQRRISIHAPRVGRDIIVHLFFAAFRHFNPRAPCGARQLFPKNDHSYTKFQSTRPVWGATTEMGITGTTAKISIHAPRVGRDVIAISCLRFPGNFNPRAPCGARLLILYALPRYVGISIHAPRVGRDPLFTSTSPKACSFQSTRPVWGATRVHRRVRFQHCNFNPRAPCGARHGRERFCRAF